MNVRDDATSHAEVETIDVVVRCRNEMPHTRRTLEALAAQRDVRARVLFIDCRSTDGSREAASASAACTIDLDPAAYIPGAVLNLAMERTHSERVAFVNADAVPVGEHALADLLAPLERRSVAATFGRQVPRTDAVAVTRNDYARAFGEMPGPTRWGRFFSMAASAIRRDAWERLRFDEMLRYSEDCDWTRRITALGYEVVYVPNVQFEHSHEYDLKSQWRRRRGEGEADARIHRVGRPSVLWDFVRPFGGAMARDLRGGVLSVHSLSVRAAQAGGYLAGRLEASRRRRNGERP